jgi:cytosine/adenosine deaminase-related metal-dependent hydrolase
MTVYRAAWICPIDRPPIKDGWIAIDRGRILGVGTAQSHPRAAAPAHPSALAPSHDLGRVAVMPGLINAHIHLELSYLRGRVPPAAKFTEWVKQLIMIRGGVEKADDPKVLAGIDDAIKELRASGTVAVGDISNSLASAAPMARAGLPGVIFHEHLGFKERDGQLIEKSRAARAAAASAGVRVSLAPHAPYSTSPELFRAVRAAVDELQHPIMSVHLGESAEEVELLAHGTGPWRGMLEFIKAWRDDWPIPACGPVEYLDGLGVLDAKTLVIHGVQFKGDALERLAAIGATVVTCPRSNQWVGVGYPPIAAFYLSGVAVAVGTDSLASVEDLNLFSELKTMRMLAPGVPARTLLQSATITGARALGLEDEFGTLSPGKRAAMIAVDLEDAEGNVEEYLVSGITPSQIQPLNP